MENHDEPMALSALSGSSVSFDREHLPERLKLFNWGINQTPDGDIVVDDVSVAALNKQIAADTFKRIVLDFEHQSLKGHPNYVPSPRHNAAHGDLEVVPGDGVYLTALAWTPKGVEHGPDYCDLSPVAIHTKRKSTGGSAVLLGILSAALCDNGAARGISAFSASYQPPEAIMDDQAKIIDGLQTALATLTGENKSLKGMIEAYGQKIDAQAAVIEDFRKRLDEPAVTAASFDQVRAIADAAVKPEALDEGRRQVSALSARIDSLQKGQMIQMAVLQGKAVTLDETAVSALSVESLAQHISGLGATLPVHRLTPAGSLPEAEPSTTSLSSEIDALIAQIRRETGIQDFQGLWAIARGRKPDLFKK